MRVCVQRLRGASLGVVVLSLVIALPLLGLVWSLPASAATASGSGMRAAATRVQSLLAGAPPIFSHRALRFQRVLGQQDWYTCGAAAVATWLTFYLDRPATEGEVLQIALTSMLSRGEAASGGLTLRALRVALTHFGVAAHAYRIDGEGLVEHFARGGLPVLIHVTRPQLHYVLAVGAVGDRILLADPSYGEQSVTLSQLVHGKGFQGVVLAAGVEERTAVSVRERQRAALQAHASSLARLARLRDVGAW